MRRAILLLMLIGAAPARAQDVLAAVRADRWAEADAAAAALPDPLARKLVRYYRLLSPGMASAGEIAAFLADDPAWPQAPMLARRLQEAIAAGPVLPDLCRSQPAPPGVRCPRDPAADARAAWVRGVDGPAEIAFLRQWGRVLTEDDQWSRFDRLAWTDAGAPGGPAARQAMRLDPASQVAAQARLALRRDDATAPALAAALPAGARVEPGLVLDLARWYRRAGLDKDAVGVWTTLGAAAEAAAPPDRRPAFWSERNELARRLLRFGDPAEAYAVAAGATRAGEAGLDAEFLAGWIALRRLNQPDVAARHFTALAGLSRAAITQGRAGFWLGRSRAAADDPEGARAAYLAAAAWPMTYYGQLAACALGEDPNALGQRILSLRDPDWTADAAAAFAGQELTHAAALLVAWGEPRRARAFLLRLDELADEPGTRALAARFAAGLGLPDQAVAIARRAGRDGVVLAEAGWPRPVSPPAGGIEPAVALGLIRQESSFDAGAASPVGARGLMQLMPATAAAVARRLNEPASMPALTADPAYNMRLGTTYLQGLLDQFGGALPLALAGYNAGPHRVQAWLTAQGDPLAGGADMVDWIEMIPFNETRNYVQRVIENIVIYRAQRGEAAAHPLSRWTG
jgi:soluble lytic murein transglycosylase